MALFVIFNSISLFRFPKVEGFLHVQARKRAEESHFLYISGVELSKSDNLRKQAPSLMQTKQMYCKFAKVDDFMCTPFPSLNVSTFLKDSTKKLPESERIQPQLADCSLKLT